MSNSIKTLIESRVSTGRYDATRILADETVSELVRLATRAPSAYNLQNWRFIAVRSDEAKQRLKAAAYDQPQVVDAQTPRFDDHVLSLTYCRRMHVETPKLWKRESTPPTSGVGPNWVQR